MEKKEITEEKEIIDTKDKLEENSKVINELTTVENKKMRHTLIIICIAATALLFVFIIINALNKKDYESGTNYNNRDLHWKIVDGATITSEALNFKCFLTDEEGKIKIGETSIFGVGDYLLCDMSINSNSVTQIDYMSVDFDSKNIDLVKVYSISDIWKIETTKNDNVSSISIASENKIDKNNLADVRFHLFIKDNIDVDKSFKIVLKNINIHNEEYEPDIYMHIKDKDIEFNTDERRYYQKNDSIIFEKLQTNGKFQKKNEYKCISSNSCNVNIASQSFSYKNDNKDVVMISDGDNWNTSIIYDIEKGALGTYGGRPSWLYTKNSTHQDGTYIYLMAKDSDKFGIIDINGKIIHEFNLGNINANVPSGILNSVYSIENNMIVDQRNNKYGISKITSSDTVVDYKFDSIRLTTNNKYFKAKLDNKWYLYSFNTKDKVTNEGYDELFIVNDEIIITEKDKYLYIKDYNGNNLVEDRIEDLSKEYQEYVCCAANPGIAIDVKDNIITITTYKDNDWEKYNQYEYNISTKSLIMKKEYNGTN